MTLTAGVGQGAEGRYDTGGRADGRGLRTGGAVRMALEVTYSVINWRRSGITWRAI
jgi:hypothetical protein